MKKDAILKILEDHKNKRGIDNWNKLGYANLTSYGIGLTQLKKIAKQFGKDHVLAQKLWIVPNYDVKIIAILIEEPKKIDSLQINTMVNEIHMGMLTHVWVQILFSKVSFAKEIAEYWRENENNVKRRCGFALLYYLARDTKTSDSYFYPILERIKTQIQQEENYVKDAMNNALFGIGQRSKELNLTCIEIAREVGKIVVDYGNNSCEAIDVIKHLTSNRIKQKFN
ncbi:MAG: hypothetical protein COC16_00025 [Lutibacter sp.]|nr:MAG: hypothetical protein COC16_00025 [Lutibacter sp.]